MSVLSASGIISFARGIPAPQMFPADEPPGLRVGYGLPPEHLARLSFCFPSVGEVSVGADRLAATARSRLAGLGAA